MMMMSRPAVHPVEIQPMTIAAPRVRMTDLQGTAGTLGSLILRICQLVFAVISICVMVSTSDFPTVTAFSYLVAAVGLQIIWSLVLAIADVYAILVKRSFRNAAVVSLFAIGDGVIITTVHDSTLVQLTSTLKFSLVSFLPGADLEARLLLLLHLLLPVHQLELQSLLAMILTNAS